MIDGDFPEAISEVNVVPLADVSLVLLMILLVLSPMMRHRLLPVRAAAPAPAAVPASELLAQEPPELVLLVGLDAEGFLLGSRRLASAAELAAALRPELERRRDKKVFLSPAPDVAVDLVVRALETLKACGARSVALVQSQDDVPEIHGTLPAPAPAP